MSDAPLPAPADVLAFGPHPDDVEMCAGGLLLKLRKAGYRCAIVDLTRGEAATRGTPETRALEVAEASRLLGLVGRENLGLPDGGLEVTAAMTRPVIEAIRRWRPRLVVGPCPVDLHPDHEAAAQLVRRAYYLATVAKAPGVTLPLHRPQALVHYMGHKEPVPTFVVDVSAEWDEKVRVIRCYASQLGIDGRGGPATNISSPDFLRRFEGRFTYWGGRVGATHAEPFFAERVIALEDPVAALRSPDGAVR
jgi:bacillithiol biosynthesis deacetylase BshB1